MSPARRSRISLYLATLALAAAGPAQAAPVGGGDLLHELNRAMIQLAGRVSPAVVQIQATGFRAASGGDLPPGLVGRRRAVGSGFVVDADGYILTNNHVIAGANEIEVLLTAPEGVPVDERDRLLDAKVIGAEPDIDLALLKVDAHGLAALVLDPKTTVHQGELVFAIGSPEGLDRTVTMGIVGAAARQLEMSPPMAYIQTDAPINPGNSGGPLVNVDGAVVGINTFIFSQSGGNQGLGFAIPAPVAHLVYQSLRKDGRVKLVEVGVSTQAITPPLATALGLSRKWGVIVADVAPGSAAQAAGVQLNDVILSFDGRPIDSEAALTTARYLHPASEPIRLVLQRGAKRIELKVQGRERPKVADLADFVDATRGLIRELGILGVDVGPRLRGVIPPLLIVGGVVVAARTLDATSPGSGLQRGDVIHAVNRKEIDSVETLRHTLRDVEPGTPVVIQIERNGTLAYLSFDME
jgi:serine protease Do